MSPPLPPIAHPLPALSEHQVKVLSVLLRRAIANSQLVLHEQALDEAGSETEEGESIAAEDWAVDVAMVDYADGTPTRIGLHLYVSGADLAHLSGED